MCVETEVSMHDISWNFFAFLYDFKTLYAAVVAPCDQHILSQRENRDKKAIDPDVMKVGQSAGMSILLRCYC